MQQVYNGVLSVGAGLVIWVCAYIFVTLGVEFVFSIPATWLIGELIMPRGLRDEN
jgi:hypothetical protein